MYRVSADGGAGPARPGAKPFTGRGGALSAATYSHSDSVHCRQQQRHAGSGTHYTGELFKFAADMNVVHVPFKGTPEALTDTMTGRVHYYFSPVMPALPC